MLLDDTIEGFWLSKKRNLSVHTVADYELTFHRLREFLGNPEFESITADDLNRFMNHLRGKLALSPKTLLNPIGLRYPRCTRRLRSRLE